MINKEPFKIYIAVYLVLVDDNNILLLKRKNTGYQDGNYHLVSGHLDGRETAAEGMVREASEEAGITIKPEDLKVVFVNHRFSPSREYIDIYLSASKWDGEITNKEPEKCDDLRWFPLDDLPANISKDVKINLQNIQKGFFYGEYGWSERV